MYMCWLACIYCWLNHLGASKNQTKFSSNTTTSRRETCWMRTGDLLSICFSLNQRFDSTWSLGKGYHPYSQPANLWTKMLSTIPNFRVGGFNQQTLLQEDLNVWGRLPSSCAIYSERLDARDFGPAKGIFSSPLKALPLGNHASNGGN